MIQRSFAALALAACALPACAFAQLTTYNGYGVLPAYTHSTAADITSYDWSSSSELYYMTSPASGGYDVWKAGTSPANVFHSSSNFAGLSVLAIGNSIYFNDNASDFTMQNLYQFDSRAGSPNIAPPTAIINSSLHSYQGDLYLSGAPGFDAGRIYYSDLAADGSLVSNPARDLGKGSEFGSPGPLAFDLAGNLYYSPGFGDLSIYKFAAAEVARALTDTGSTVQLVGEKWLDYTTAGITKGGATSMLLDSNGDLLVTITSYLEPSFLYRFGVGETGQYDGSSTMVLRDTARVGELRLREGEVYLSSGNSIYKVVPEPGSGTLLLVALGGLAGRRMRRSRAVAAAVCLTSLVVGAPHAKAGPFSSALKNTTAGAPDAGIPGFVGSAGDGVVAGNSPNPIFVGWAASVQSYLPADGVLPAFANTANALGPATGNIGFVTSLGEVPASSNGPRPLPGSITLGFNLPIYNGSGADFATFENSFISQGQSGVAGQLFGELGFVEASTDGVNFARFPSTSLTSSAVGSIGTFDPTNVHNLIGKHVNANGISWGTPFDLQDLVNDPLVVLGLVDLRQVRYLRIVDIPGDGTSFDSLGRPIYDPFQSFAGSGGVDLDALGVIHQIPEPHTGGLVALGLGLLSSRLRAA